MTLWTTTEEWLCWHCVGLVCVRAGVCKTIKIRFIYGFCIEDNKARQPVFRVSSKRFAQLAVKNTIKSQTNQFTQRGHVALLFVSLQFFFSTTPKYVGVIQQTPKGSRSARKTKSKYWSTISNLLVYSTGTSFLHLNVICWLIWIVTWVHFQIVSYSSSWSRSGL